MNVTCYLAALLQRMNGRGDVNTVKNFKLLVSVNVFIINVHL